MDTNKKCSAMTAKMTPCKNRATYQKNGDFLCHAHKNHKTPRTKNSLTNRMGSLRYSACVSLNIPLNKVFNINENNEETMLDNSECFYCDCKRTTQHVDHIEPVIIDKQPTDIFVESIYNKVPCCEQCNTSKGKKNAEEFLKKKITNPEILKEKLSILAYRRKKIPQVPKNYFNNMKRNFNKFIEITEAMSKKLEEGLDIVDHFGNLTIT